MLEYIEETHQYLYNGILVPSVSGILHKYLFKDKYKDVPEYILKAKAQYGSQLHEAIETLEKDNILIDKLNEQQKSSIKQYLDIKEQNNLEVIKQEEMVCYKGIYAGRFDIYGKVQNILSLCDIKTTVELDLEYCKYQLNLYRFAHKDKNKIKKLYILWLPKKGIGQLVEVNVMSDKEIKELLKRCELL